jgi:CRISPR-associated protein Csm5
MQASDLVSRTHTVTLRPLTPTHVWSGQRLIVGLDLVQLGVDRFCLVDAEKLPPDAILEMSRMRLEDIPKFLERLGSSLPCRQELRVGGEPPRVGAQVLELNKYVVPGSTLKGYIRTALLYYLLNQIKDADRLKDILRSGIDPSADPRRVSEGLEAIFFRTPRLKKQRGFVDSLQSLLVSDPTVELSPECYRVTQILVYELPRLAIVASLHAIVVSCGRLVYTLNVMKPLKEGLTLIDRAKGDHSRILERLQLLSREDLLGALRIFGCYVLSTELERVKGIKELENYAVLLTKFSEMYCRSGSTCVPAKIGFAAGIHSKTVIGLVKRVDPDLYASVRSSMESQIRHVWDELTLKLTRTEQGLVGLGWCELCLS